MQPRAPRQLEPRDIPVIDVSDLIDGRDPESVGRQLVRAATEVGFIYIRGHGVPEALLEKAREVGFQFFRLPEARKLEVSTNTYHHGYLKPGSSRMYDSAEVDLKESFNWGVELDGAVLEAQSNPLLGPNQWPTAMPSLEAALYPFFEAASECAEALLRGFAVGASLAPDFFIAERDQPLSRGSLQYYPPQPEESGAEQFGVAPHTDFGMLTLLCQDAVGGLELQLPGGDWVAVPPIPGTLVVNVGDLLSRWSNGRFRSTPHRVVNRTRRERLSLVLAYDPNFETLIDPRHFCASGEQPCAAPLCCGDYLLWRFAKAFAYRQ